MSEPPNTADLLVALARLETKLDGLAEQLPARIDDQETRLRSLERTRWPLPSVAALAAVGAVAAQIWHR